jgi:response regulator RpfG family c-di-GMP phosphodiesterase
MSMEGKTLPEIAIGVDTTLRSPSIRVLIADSDESQLAAYCEVLREDFEMVTAARGVECVSRMRAFMPHILVLEPHLPWGGGDGLLAVIHDDPVLVAIPVMILGSRRDPRVLKNIAEFRISDYRAKPKSPTQLAARIHRVLENNGQRSVPVTRSFEGAHSVVPSSFRSVQFVKAIHPPAPGA